MTGAVEGGLHESSSNSTTVLGLNVSMRQTQIVLAPNISHETNAQIHPVSISRLPPCSAEPSSAARELEGFRGAVDGVLVFAAAGEELPTWRRRVGQPGCRPRLRAQDAKKQPPPYASEKAGCSY